MLGELVGARVPEGLGRVIDGQKLGRHACQVWDNGTRVAIARVHLFNARVWIHLVLILSPLAGTISIASSHFSDTCTRSMQHRVLRKDKALGP